MTSSRTRRLGSLLWHRNFRLLWIGETISGAGSSMAAIGVPLLAVTVLRASTFAVSALTAAAYLLRIRPLTSPAAPAPPSSAPAPPSSAPAPPSSAPAPPSPASGLSAAPAAPDPSAAPGPSAESLPRGRLYDQTWEGIRFVAGDSYLRLFTAYAAVANLAYTGNLALVVVFLIRVVGLGSGAVGVLTATGGLGGLLGALVARRLTRAFGTARALLLTTLGCGLSGLLIPLTARGPRIACYVAGSALVAGGIVVGNVILGSFRQEYRPPPMLGRVTASMRFLVYGAIPLGALLAGGLGTALGVRNALWADLAMFAASCLFLLSRDIRTARDLPRRPLTPSAPAASRRQPGLRR